VNPVRAYIGLGANLGDAVANVCAAMDALTQIPAMCVVARSALYLTSPWGVTDQADFINAAVGLDSTLSPHEVLAVLQQLEARAGRTRERRWGPRVLDLDLLLYGDACVHDEHLEVPHPRLAERAFVLLPLADIAPAVQIPGKGPVRDLLARADTTGCRRLP
jgi:2-amino-4-hydroxy-6-hydroxymethyldihydropteridine diphosphokinase